MLNHSLQPKLKERRLSGRLDTLQERAQYAKTQQLSPVEFLALLLDEEIERRHQAQLLRREKQARFECPKRLTQFDFSAVPTLDRGLVVEMATCQFMAAHHNWLVSGPTGVGKSHLASAIGHEAIKRGYRVLAYPTHRLLGELYAARADGS